MPKELSAWIFCCYDRRKLEEGTIVIQCDNYIWVESLLGAFNCKGCKSLIHFSGIDRRICLPMQEQAFVDVCEKKALKIMKEMQRECV